MRKRDDILQMMTKIKVAPDLFLPVATHTARLNTATSTTTGSAVMEDGYKGRKDIYLR